METLLDLSIPLDDKYKWTIFAAFAIGCIYFAHQFISTPKSTEPDHLSSNFESLSPSSTVTRYLNTYSPTKNKNRIHIHGGKFTLDLTTADSVEITGTPLINQAIHWTLDATNIGMSALTSYNFAISLSAFTSWQDGSINISARLITQKDHKAYEIRRITCSPSKNNDDIRLLNFKFPSGVQCNRGEMFTLEIHLLWTRGCHFKAIETYFSDPSNYGTQVDSFVIEVNTNTDKIISRDFTLYRVNKSSRLLIPYSSALKDLLERKVQWIISPNMDEVYLIRITDPVSEMQGRLSQY